MPIRVYSRSQQRPGTSSAGVNLPFKIEKTTVAGKQGQFVLVRDGFLQNSLDSQDYTPISGLNTPFQVGISSIIYLEVVYDLDYGYPRMANICEGNLQPGNVLYRPSYNSQYSNRFENKGAALHSGWGTYYDASIPGYATNFGFNYDIAEKSALEANDTFAYSFGYSSLMNYVATGDGEYVPLNFGTPRAALENFAYNANSSDGYYSDTSLKRTTSADPPANQFSNQIKESLAGFTGLDNRTDYAQLRSYTLIGYTSPSRITLNDVEATFTDYSNSKNNQGFIVQSLFSNLMIQGFIDQSDLPLRIPCPYSGPVYAY